MRIRPTHFFLALILIASFFAEASKTPLGTVLTVLFLILVVAAVAPSVANATTGITIAHAGFSPNINLTRSPGVTAAVPILPLIFIGIGIGYVLDEMGGIL